MTEKMRIADRMACLGELSAALAHEIRTPLASVCGSIEILRDSLKPEGQDGRLFSLVIKESERLRGIIEHFLEFARSRPNSFKEISLERALREVVALVRNHPAFRDPMRISLDGPDLPGIRADEETIKQVFYNLALNAIESLNGSGGELSIELAGPIEDEGRKYARVTFEDNGAGIDEADLARVFQPFFTRKRAGTGLGLAIACKIVEDHGGRIQLRSTKGVGTVASVFLPMERTPVPETYYGQRSSRDLVGNTSNRAE
jgi:two-component system sensor histidine kinase PilS (NtrC family)